MSERPPPPVPAECSMAGNDWFPFYFDRLRKSKWWRRASDVARARNVMMWGEAFKSQPAGSLPDDDDELAEAAGYGMDVEAFLAVKDEIMAPWVLCSDGRWYHPTVCEVVLDAWERASDRRKAAAERQRRRRERVRDAHLSSANVTPIRQPVTPSAAHVTRDNAESERDFAIQTVQTVQDSMEAIASLSPNGDEKPANDYPDQFEVCWKAYPHVKGRSSKKLSFGQWRRIPAARRALLPSAIARYARDGREPRMDCGAPAMERWLRDEKFVDWLEEPATTAQAPTFDGPPEIWSAVVAAKGEPFAVSYLTRCKFRDGALTTSSATTFDRLRREVGRELDAIGVRLLQGAAA